MVSKDQITVVITSYNCESTIGAAIASTLSQTQRPSRIIVVDDGSTDGTVSEILRFNNDITLLQQPNGGPSAARNRGVSESQTEWIALLDGDDLWHKDKLERQLQTINSYPQLDLLATSWSRSDPAPGAFSMKLSRISYVSLLVMNRFQTSTVLVKKTELQRCGGFNSALDSVEDWGAWLNLSRESQLGILEEPLVLYRDTATGVSKDLSKFFDKMLILLEQERNAGLVNDNLFKTIAAWHYLRLSTAMALEHHYQDALKVVFKLLNSPYKRATPSALRQYLFPFLIDRVERRRQLFTK